MRKLRAEERHPREVLVRFLVLLFGFLGGQPRGKVHARDQTSASAPIAAPCLAIFITGREPRAS